MPESGPPSTLLAFDFGKRRIGVAVGQNVTGSASPLGVIANADEGLDGDAVDRLIAEWRPDCLVVGLPLHADGAAGEMTDSALRFAKWLDRYGLPVVTTDERYSSVEAMQMLTEARASGSRGRIAKADVDTAAAVLIAERYLSGGG